MIDSHLFNLEKDAVMIAYTSDVAAYCDKFMCGDEDLDDFFNNDSLLYSKELLGKTYAWISQENPHKIIAMITLSNDSIKANTLTNATRNRLQRGVANAKRGRNYPAVLIGRLGVSIDYQHKGYNIGSQILSFVKDWFRTADNKTGCRFIVVDAYNNETTLRFYERNNFKLLYKDSAEEHNFFNVNLNEVLRTRFYYFDLKEV
jgi:GNAT superfamily N-acetyltransferase